MAVFVAAGDESERGEQKGAFLYGGFVGPSRDWIDWFAPAGEERVLNVLPRSHSFIWPIFARRSGVTGTASNQPKGR